MPRRRFNRVRRGGGAGMGSLFIAGTETGVGKTVVVAALARAAVAAGAVPAICKPFLTDDLEDRMVVTIALARMSRPPMGRVAMAPFIYGSDYELNSLASPYTCMRVGGGSVDVGSILGTIAKMRRGAGPLMVEGTGGAMAPIRSGYLMADLIRDSGIPAVMVTTNRVGSLNLSVMSAASCRERGAAPIGFVVNCVDPDGYEPGQIGADIEAVTGVPVLASIRLHGGRPPPKRKKGSLFGSRPPLGEDGSMAYIRDMPKSMRRSAAVATRIHRGGGLDGLARRLLGGGEGERPTARWGRKKGRKAGHGGGRRGAP